MKKFFPVVAISLLFLGACDSATRSDATDFGASSSAVGAMTASEAMMEEEAATASASEPESEPRVIRVEAGNWAFTPSVITVKRGEKVRIQLVGVSGRHGFASSGLGINAEISAGQTMMVDLPTDKAGTFVFHCSIPCGSGHGGMAGKIIIEE